MKSSKKTVSQKFLIYAFFICVIFYVGFALLDGPVWAKDSASYVDMAISREPVYPLFLALFRKIFGEAPGRNNLPAYLFYVVIAQALVNAYAVWVLVRAVLRKTDKVRICGEDSKGALSHDKRTDALSWFSPMLLAALAGDFHFIVALLNRFVAGRGSMYAEAILTESLAMPLYLIFIVRLWELYDTGDGSVVSGMSLFLRLALLAFLLIGLRKQMMVVLLLWGTVMLLFDALPILSHILRTKKGLTGHGLIKGYTRFIAAGALILIVLVANNAFERTYNKVIHDRAVTHTGNGKAMMCTLLYAADPAEDTMLFQNCQTGGLCELFTDILATCDEMGLLKINLETGNAHYYIDEAGQQEEGNAEQAFETALQTVKENRAKEGDTALKQNVSWLTLGEHYAASYDIIGYEVCDPMIQSYLEARGFTGIDAAIAYDEIVAEFNRVLMQQKKGDLVQVFFINFVKGLVATNARIHPALIVPSLLLYAIYIVLLVMCFLLGSHDTGDGSTVSGFIDTENRSSVSSFNLATIVALAILINAGVVGLMIFPQPRYMIYNMGLFYTALAMMAFVLYSKVWITRKHTNGRN